MQVARKIVAEKATGPASNCCICRKGLPLAGRIGLNHTPHAEFLAGLLDAALSRRVNSPAYLRALSEDGAMRCDLNGASVAPVDIGHQIFALDRLAEIQANSTRTNNRHEEGS